MTTKAVESQSSPSGEFVDEETAADNLTTETELFSKPTIDTIEEATIHDVLRNERRRLLLRYLAQNGGEMTLRELSEQIAAAQTGESPPPRNIRASVYTSLHQTHLPKLDDLDIIDYDQNQKIITLNERASRVLYYTTVHATGEFTWNQCYVLWTTLGLLTILASEIGVPVISMVDGLTLAVFFLIGILFSTFYRWGLKNGIELNNYLSSIR